MIDPSCTSYDDPDFSYKEYWQGRDYEDWAERLVLTKLLGKITNKKTVVDVGAGFGRLVPEYAHVFKKCILVEPSSRMRIQAKKLLSKYKNIIVKPGRAESLPFKSGEVAVIICVRTFHHLPNPATAIAEFRRVLAPKGFLILEFANKIHFKNSFRAILRGDWGFFRHSPYDINERTEKAPFFNHHPSFVHNLLAENGFNVVRSYSVSNFRHSLAKKFLPKKFLLFLENSFSEASLTFPVLHFFGPSIFLLCRKNDLISYI